MAQNIERRVEKLESSLRVGDKPQTLDDMFKAFERGDYGRDNMMSIVSCAMSSTNPEGFFESLRKDMPDMLVDWFVDQFKRNAEKSHNSSAGESR